VAASEPGADRASILIVTADSELGAYVGELIDRRYDVVHAANALDAARRIADRRPDAVVLDAAAGARAIAALRRRLGEVPLLTLAASPDDVAGLLLAGAHDCVVKPFGTDELQVRLDALVARGRVYARRETALAGLDRAFDVAPVPMALISAEGRLVRVNRSLCTLLGFNPEELLGRMVQDLTHPADLPDEEVRRRLVLERRVILDRGTWRLARADGSYLRVSASASLVDGAEGAEACLLLHLTDTPEEATVRGGAGVLAGPPGQRAFERAVRHQLLRCRRYGEQAALVRCSLHGLPDVRASHGPEAADRVVAGILDVVRRRLRGTDVVAYVGDHEIAALLAHADMDAAHTTAEAIREAAENMRVATAHGVVGTDATVGVASLVGAGSPGRAFADAGLAMQAPRGAPPSWGASRTRARRALGGELARLLAGLEARLGAGRAQLVGGAGALVGADQDAIGLQRAREAFAHAARQERPQAMGVASRARHPHLDDAMLERVDDRVGHSRRARASSSPRAPSVPAPSSVLTRKGMHVAQLHRRALDVQLAADGLGQADDRVLGR
jgi:PAS domain S-box-containing protein/diguanylate cyclase (GGDEF)-like protein